MFAEAGHFDIKSGVLTLPGGMTVQLTGGDLNVHQDPNGMKTWTAELSLVSEQRLSSAVIEMNEPMDCRLVGVAFAWSGKALPSHFRPMGNRISIRGTGPLHVTRLDHT
jgi:hypothetical protein